MFEYAITIKKVENGYTLTPGIDTEEDIKVVELKEIDIPYDTDTKEEQVALSKVFYILQDFFGVYNDKHHEQFLEINVTEGKYDNS